MNKLAAINLAIEEVNKQAFVGSALATGFRPIKNLYGAAAGVSRRAGAGIVKRMHPSIGGPKPIPGAVGAQSAALGAQKPGLLSRVSSNPYAIAGAIGAPMIPGSAAPIP